MMYEAFAGFYDELTGNISYKERADYFHQIIQQNSPKGPILLDLACGTGSLSVEMANLGYDVIGVDCSEEMLAVAMQKRWETGLDLLFLCQDMTQLDLFGTVDSVVCALDSLNHITNPEQLRRVFEKVSLFLVPGGIFVFDVNTIHKHRCILGNHTFVYDCEETYCVWQNSYEEETNTVNIQLDFFAYEEETDSYVRSSETFAERAYPADFWETLLRETGFRLQSVYADDSFSPPEETTQRLIYVAQKNETGE